jgi:hypothetical protein
VSTFLLIKQPAVNANIEGIKKEEGKKEEITIDMHSKKKMYFYLLCISV